MRPRVTLHFAQSLDGKIDNPSLPASVRLSNAEGFRAAHQARADHDAVLVGINTVLRDDPKLNVRHISGRDPHRVVLDTRLRTPMTARLFTRESSTRVFILTSHAQRGTATAEALVDRGATVIFCAEDAEGRPQIGSALTQLADVGVSSLLVEGGRGALSAFMAAHAVDMVQTEICMAWIGDSGLSAFDLQTTGVFALTDTQTSALGDHVLVRARPVFANEHAEISASLRQL